MPCPFIALLSVQVQCPSAPGDLVSTLNTHIQDSGLDIHPPNRYAVPICPGCHTVLKSVDPTSTVLLACTFQYQSRPQLPPAPFPCPFPASLSLFSANNLAKPDFFLFLLFSFGGGDTFLAGGGCG